MLRVIIEIVPRGDERRKTTHAGAEIVCMDANGFFGDYAVSVGENKNPCVPRLDWQSRGHVMRHDRRTTVWALIEKVAAFAVAEAEKSDNR
jgi:hypothetical protein